MSEQFPDLSDAYFLLGKSRDLLHAAFNVGSIGHQQKFGSSASEAMIKASAILAATAVDLIWKDEDHVND